jgi:hypothetical protein
MAQQDVKIKITAYNATAKAFASVNRGLRSVAKASAPIAGFMTKWGLATATAAAGASAALVKMRMTAVDNLAKTADKLGATTEALAGLQHAAEISGVSTETMNMALQRMTRRVAEAAMGTGEAKGALEELNLNADALAKLPLDQQMNIVADAMQGVEKQSDRVRLAMKLFDSEGVALVNTLAGGSDGLKEMAEEASKLGIAISRVDAAMIEQANDDVLRAKSVFQGFGNQIATELSPLISELATNFYQTALDSNEAGNVGSRVAQALVNGFGHVVNAVHRLKIGINGIRFVFAKMGQFALTVVSKMTKSFDILIAGYNKLADVFDWEKITVSPSQEFQAIADAFGQTADDIKAQITESLNAPLPSDQIQAFYDNVQAKARETAEVVAANAPATVLSDTALLGEATKKMGLADKARMEGTKKLEEFEKKTAGEKTQFLMGELDTQLGGIAKHSKKLFAMQKAVQVAQAIMNTYTGATKAIASYPPPINFAMAALTVANGMAQVAQIKAQSFEGGGFTGFGARAGGLDGKGGYMAMVHPNESIVDHTKGQGQGITIVNNVDATGGGADVDQRIRVAMEVTSQQTVMQVQDLLRRQRLV